MKPPVTYRIMEALMGPLLKRLGMNCQTIYQLTAESLDRPLTRGESIRLHLHLAMCGLCRRLPAQFRALRELVRRALPHEHSGDPDACLPDEAKARIADRLKTESRPS